ncbi:MAG TPA: RIP metalloprotease RseP [Anaerolineae bacterium]|nr:RIP metalloprotease RseP [Anaerolineae bacterium]
MNIVNTIIAPAFVISLLMFVHELGHFIAAKLSDIPVEEFGFGLPPRLLTLGRLGETEYTINAIPFGAFVRPLGEDDPSQPGGFASRGKLVRASVLAAGPAMNFFLAIALFAAMFAIGVPAPAGGAGAGVYWVEPDSPAAQAGLQVGDTILQVDDLVLQEINDLREYVARKAGEEITLIVKRKGEVLPTPLRLTPRVNPPEGQGAMGIRYGPPLTKISYPWWQAIPLGVRHAFTLLGAMFVVLVEILRGVMAPEVAGPIGIAQIAGEVAKSGLLNLMEFTGLLSVNLAVVNLLPFPPLDGSRLILIVLELLRGGKRVDPEKERLVQVIGMAVLVSLMLLISYFDLLRLLSGQPILPR